MTENKTCPNCGYCPHCGRGGFHTIPYVPYMPSYPTYPYTGPIWLYDPRINGVTINAPNLTGGTTYTYNS